MCDTQSTRGSTVNVEEDDTSEDHNYKEEDEDEDEENVNEEHLTNEQLSSLKSDNQSIINHSHTSSKRCSYLIDRQS